MSVSSFPVALDRAVSDYGPIGMGTLSQIWTTLLEEFDSRFYCSARHWSVASHSSFAAR